jgi:glycosyltransferase involved in cell wall biosynthesis
VKISIAVPTYEYNDRGVEFLDDLFRTISTQTHKNYEVVISDHSVNDKIKDYCDFNEYNIPIKYYRNPDNIGNGPYNTNKAIELCSGDLIKVMFQDDFFWDDEALEKIKNEIGDRQWLVCGTNHTKDDGHNFFWDLYPQWNDRLLYGVNTISSPSVVAFKSDTKVMFDSNLTMLMDCEFYYNMNFVYGQPAYLNDILVSNRLHTEQISSRITSSNSYHDTINTEIQYCLFKHNIVT